MNTLSLFVFIDALGWKLLQDYGSFLEKRLPTAARLESIFGYSSTCDPTILTGLMPKDHGHFSFFAFDPPKSPFRIGRFLSLIPKQLSRRGRVRRLISRFVQRQLGYTGYFQLYNMPFNRLHLFDYTEKKDLYLPGGIISGARTIFDDLRDAEIPFHLSNWRKGEVENLQTLKASFKTESKPRFAYLYMAQMDALLHAKGTHHPDAKAKLRWYEEQLEALIQSAEESYDAVRLFVFSDHGMTNVTECCDLMPLIDRLNLKFGEDYAACYDSTMARFWFLNQRAETLITKALENHPQGQILSAEDHQAFGTDFPTNRYGDLFFLLNPGVLLCPSFMGETPLAGMHGYTPAHEDTDAAFLSNIPVSEFLAPLPKRLDDLYQLMKAEAFAS